MKRIARTDASPAPVWATCAACWGQGRIYCRDEERRLRPVVCYGCLGVGQTLTAPPAPPGPRGIEAPGV
jgi:hypothetical protein